MMQERAPSKKLSKAVLELKFMKKSKEKAIVQEENEERQQLYQDQLSSLHEGAEKIVMVNSYVDCLKFLPCRLSFGGMDADIEKLNEDKLTGLYIVTKSAPKEAVTQMDADISAKEMVAHYKPATHKPTPGYMNQEEDQEGVEEPNHDTHPAPKKPKKAKLRTIFTQDIERDRGGGEERRGGFRGGRGNNFRGKRGSGFRGGRGGHFKGNNDGGHRGRRGGRGGAFWKGGRGGKGMDLNVKSENTRGGQQTPRGGNFTGAKRQRKDGNWGGKRSYEDSQYQQQGRDGPGHNQNHQWGDSFQHKKIKAEPN